MRHLRVSTSTTMKTLATVSSDFVALIIVSSNVLRDSENRNDGRGHPRFFFTEALRLRPVLIRAARVLPSSPPLSHSIERHAFEGQFVGLSVSGIHRCPQTSQTATLIVFQPIRSLYHILS